MSNKKDSLGDRMKGYENISRNHLTRRTPVIIRLDGKAFHTFTRGMDKPFDAVLTKAMQETMKYLCENVQGCVLGYTQSDEITLVLTDYATISTDAWFGYNVQKMTSVAASMATLAFNKAYKAAVREWVDTVPNLMDAFKHPNLWYGHKELEEPMRKLKVYDRKICTALFDARVFSIPKDEVCNCLIWRQQDATRNSIESVGQANFSHKQLQGKSCDQVQDMLFTEKGINWNDLPTALKRGSCCVKQVVDSVYVDALDPSIPIPVRRRKWVIDTEIPVFTQDRNYIEHLL